MQRTDLMVRYLVCTECGYREADLLTDAQKACEHAWIEVAVPQTAIERREIRRRIDAKLLACDPWKPKWPRNVRG